MTELVPEDASSRSGMVDKALTLIALVLLLLLARSIHGLWTATVPLSGANGFGTASVPYSDALDPWLHGALSYFLHNRPFDNLYRPTIGLFYGTIISITSRTESIPVFSDVICYAGFFGLFICGGRGYRLPLTGTLAILVVFFGYIIRPLNPETLCIDFWALGVTLAGVWMLALGDAKDAPSPSTVAAGFFLLGLVACVRGPQIGSGIVLFILVVPGWLRRRQWFAVVVFAVLFALPTLIDSTIRRLYHSEDNVSVVLYSFYSDPTHQWNPTIGARYIHERPATLEVLRNYLRLLFSRDGLTIYSRNCAVVLSHASSLLGDKRFLLTFVSVVLFGLRRHLIWLRRIHLERRQLVLGSITIAFVGALAVFVPAPYFRLASVVGAIGLIGIFAVFTRRRLLAGLMLGFCGALAVHAALGIAGGIRVIETYETLLLAGIIVFAAGDCNLEPCEMRRLPWLAGTVFIMTAAMYTGNLFVGREGKSRMREELSNPQSAMKISGSEVQDRSLYLEGDFSVFFTKFDRLPFGTVRHYSKIEAPNGFANGSLINPCIVSWTTGGPQPLRIF